MARRLLSLLAAALVLCCCGSGEGEAVSYETVAARGRPEGLMAPGGQQGEKQSRRDGRGPQAQRSGRDERSEVSEGTASPGNIAAAEWVLGTARLYPTEFSGLPRAPKGYKPVYISHYGRHGSRYLVDPGQYDSVYSVLSQAAADGKLAPEGERVWRLYSDVYPSFDKHEGELTPLGAEQHRGIAARMVRRYPSLFRKGCRVEANSTNFERTMLSMLNFTQTLQAMQPRLEIHSDASRSYMGRIHQHTLENPRATEYDIRWKKGNGLWRPAFEDYTAALIDPEPFCKRLFTDFGWLKDICNPLDFELDFCDVAMNLPSCELGCGLLEAFTEDELMLIGRLDNYRFYVSKSRWPGYDRRACYLSESVLGDILDRTAEDIANGVSVRLRFGHDGCIMALLALLRLEGWGAEIADPADSWKVWDVSQIPMASNLQLVLFAPRRSGSSPAAEDLLLLPLLNEEPLALPLEEVTRGYYRWKDFLDYCGPLLEEARTVLSVHK